MPAARLLGVAMRILPLVNSRAGRRPGIPALVAVGLLVSLLALPAAAGNQGGSGGGAAVPKLAWVACGDEAPGSSAPPPRCRWTTTGPTGPRSAWP